MKKFSLLLFLGLIWSWCGSAQVAIGTQESTTSDFPIFSCYEFSYSQQLIYQSEINADGDITSISFYFASEASTNDESSDWTIYMGHTSKTEFANDTDWVPLSDLTEVFSGTVTYPPAGNQMVITFDTPFTYNNSDNLVFAVDENEPGYDCSNYFGSTSPYAVNRTLYYRNDTVNPDPASPPAAYGMSKAINNIILGGIQQACPAPTDLAVTATTTTTADVEWTENGTATEWEVVYGAVGFDPDTEGTTVTDDDGTAGMTLTGLDASSEYEYYVRSVCGPAESSSFAGPGSFATNCVADDVPYYLPFETGANCVSFENLGSGSGWGIATGNNSGFSGTYARYRWSGSEADAWLYTNAVSLTAGVEYRLTYTYGNNSTSYVEKMNVFYGTDNEASAMATELADHPQIDDGTPHTNIVLFTPATTDDYYFGFHAYSTDNQFYLLLDNIEVVEAPSCPEPIDVVVDSVTADSANVSWTAGGTETEWEVLYGAPGFDPAAEGDTIQVSTDPETTIPGLDADTQYEFYVRGICAVGDESLWEGPVTFTTACLPAAIPFFEGFEAGYTDGETLAGCWTQVSETGTDSFIANSSESTYNRDARTGDFNVYLRYGNTQWMFYALDLTADTAYELKFYARQDASSGATVEAAFGDSANTAAMTTVVIPSAQVVAGDYQEFSGTFTPATSGTYYIGIKGSLNYVPYYLSIDDISVDLAPDCLKPTDLVVTSLSGSSANISWTPGGSETEWEVLYGEAGFDPTTDGTTLTVNTDPETTISGLDANTDYEFYVTAICAPGEESEMAGPTGFATLCDPTTVPYYQDFETAVVPDLPECTSSENLGNGNNWKTGVYNQNGMSGNTLQYGYHSTEPANAWFYTQGIQMEPGVDYQISFNYYGSNTWPEKMKVAFGAGAVSTAMTTELADYPNIDGAGVANITFTVPASDVYYFGFNVYSDANQNYLYVDNISIEEVVACLEPTDLTVANITQDSADLSWTAGGSETEWEVVYGEAGFDPATAGTTVAVNTDPETTITGLDPETDYEFYVTALCGAGNESDMAGPQAFTTLAIVCDAPTDVEVSDITVDGATISWTASATETGGYTVDVYLEGADPNTATPEVTEIVATGITTVDVTGLDQDTSYDVYVTTICDGGNTAMSSAVNFVTLDLGINSSALTAVNYYPNPVKEELTLTAGKSIDVITVFNLLGQTVLEVQPNASSATINMSALPTGTYVLKASISDAVSTFKVVKQ